MPMTAERALCSTVLVISRQIASMRLAITARSRALIPSSPPAAGEAAADAAVSAVDASSMARVPLRWPRAKLSTFGEPGRALVAGPGGT